MEQEKIHKKQENKQNKRKKTGQEPEKMLEKGEEEVRQVSENLRDASSIIDEVLADFIPEQGETEIIGAPKDKPSLREVSSEEFIRAFRQKAGQ